TPTQAGQAGLSMKSSPVDIDTSLNGQHEVGRGPINHRTFADAIPPRYGLMDRLTGIERPHEPSPTSHGTRVKAGATRLAPGGLWEPHNAYRSRNLKQIQVNHQAYVIRGRTRLFCARLVPPWRLFEWFPSNMELTSPPIAVCLVSSGTSNEGNIQGCWCQEAPGGTILGT
ncbi:hypothetical protein THAOC_29035, partial [Thalassiosira oceanica]